MSVSLNPSTTLGFPRPLTQHVKRTLAITNQNSQPVAFKVKTTAPKLYCVRPNSGRVEPGETVEVQVMLQAMKEEPPLGAKCKDKFLIQSTLITPEKETLPLQDIWSGETPEDAIHSQKVRVAYLPPEGQTVPEEDEPHAGPAPHEPEMHLAQTGYYGTALPHGQNGHAPIPSFNEHDDGLAANNIDHELHHDAPSTPPPEISRRQPTPPPAPAPAPPAPVSAPEPPLVHVNVHTPPPAPPAPAPIPAPVDPNPELLSKLNDAHAEIERLRNLISSMPEPSTVPSQTVISGTAADIRRRNRALSDDGASTLGGETDVGSYVSEASMQPEGVPLQVVIIVALGVFITTYLFF